MVELVRRYKHYTNVPQYCIMRAFPITRWETHTNSLPSLRPRGAKSLVLYLSSSDSDVYITEVLVICCPVLTRCHMC